MRNCRHIINTIIILSLSIHATASTDQEEHLHLGNGIAAIAEEKLLLLNN